MKKTLIASVCALALTLPAMAQTSNSPSGNSNTVPVDNSTTGSTTNRSTSAPTTSANQPPSLPGSSSVPSTSTTNSAAPTSGTFPTIGATDIFSSKLRGLNIYNQDNRSIGEIEDVAFGANNTVEAYIVSVGGFLGLGQRYVAINPSAVDVKWDASGKKWSAKMNATADQLNAAPEFKYPNNS